MENIVRRKVLLITCSFGEFRDSHTIRLRNMLSGSSLGDVSVTCIVPCEAISMPTAVYGKSMEVIGTGIPFFLRIERKIKSLGLSKFSWVYKNLSYRLSFPDQFMGWSVMAARKLRKININDFDVILSASGSPEAHILARKLKKSSNALWIADFGDPWAYVDKMIRPWYFRYTKRVEHRLLQGVDSCIFTTLSTKKLYESRFGIKKSMVIPYGFSKNDLPRLIRSPKNDSIWTIGHIGTAHKSDRNVIPSIQAFDELSASNGFKSRYILCGKHSMEFDDYLRNTNIDEQLMEQAVPLEKAISLTYELDIQLLVGNKQGSQLPGKVFMAAAIPSPIIFIAQCDEAGDEAYQFLKDLKGVVFVSNDSPSIKRGLSQIINNWSHYVDESIARVNSELLSFYESESLSDQLRKSIE